MVNREDTNWNEGIRMPVDQPKTKTEAEAKEATPDLNR
jgi:hypothetical protein